MATDILSRDIRKYSASLFKDDMPPEQVDLVASLIEEADFTASLAESLHQIARRVKRETFSASAQEIVDAALDKLDLSLRKIMPDEGVPDPVLPAGHVPTAENLRDRLLSLGPQVTSAERGAILALLGSVERAEYLIERVDSERKSVDRSLAAGRAASAAKENEIAPLKGTDDLSTAPAG